MTLDLICEVELPAPQRAALRRQVARMVRAASLTDGRAYEASLTLTTDAVIHRLNKQFRNQDRPTDVLAFAQREAASAHADLLGDIVISVETARRQAKRGLPAELLHLASHGLCHLLGYDHRDDAEEAEMNARARALIREAEGRGRTKRA